MADTRSYLEMSDEELLAAPPPDGAATPPAEVKPAEEVAPAVEKKDEGVVPGAGDPAAEVAPAADAEAQGEGEGAEGTAGDGTGTDAAADDVAPATAESGKEVTGQEPNKEDKEGAGEKVDPVDPNAPKKEEVAVDYKAEYERLLAPFKANGREVAVKSVDDAIALMQMGANYNKKMAALKPNLKVLKLLENNNLLDEEKLSFLIDLEKKNPDAINKLIKDSGINPMDLDAEKAGEYKPKTQTVDDRQIELDTVLEEIQDSPTYTQVVTLVAKEWDGKSKQIIADAPQLLKVINDHMASGVYDVIRNEMESERVFGRLKGLSDIEAYRAVGDAIQARGGFDHLFKKQESTPQPKPVVVPATKKPEDPALIEKRRAAAPTRPAVPTTVKADFNPLAMSDEEFAKLAQPVYR